jgi:ribonuclease HI
VKIQGHQTNQIAELSAIVSALEILSVDKCKDSLVQILTDSMYSIKCVTVWGGNWQRNGWKTANGKPVKNKELVEKAIVLTNKLNARFMHINSHQPAPLDKNSEEYLLWYFNQQADRLATASIRN